MKPYTPTLVLALILSLSSPIHAAAVITIIESGSDVSATIESGSTLDLTGLTQFSGGSSGNSSLNPSFPVFLVGGGSEVPTDSYSGAFSTPSNFGTGGLTFATSAAGDFVGWTGGGSGSVIVSDGYVSGSLLSGSSTWASSSFSSLGLATGSYEFSWASDSITLNIVPIPAAAWLFGSALAGLGWIRRKQTV